MHFVDLIKSFYGEIGRYVFDDPDIFTCFRYFRNCMVRNYIVRSYIVRIYIVRGYMVSPKCLYSLTCLTIILLKKRGGCSC